MARQSLTFDDVCELARALPDIEEITARGVASLKVRGKMLACPAIHRSAEPNTMVVRMGFDERATLIAADPGAYYVTEHYVNYPSVLVRLSRIHRDAVRDLLGMSSRFVTSDSRKKRPGGARKAKIARKAAR